MTSSSPPPECSWNVLLFEKLDPILTPIIYIKLHPSIYLSVHEEASSQICWETKETNWFFSSQLIRYRQEFAEINEGCNSNVFAPVSDAAAECAVYFSAKQDKGYLRLSNRRLEFIFCWKTNMFSWECIKIRSKGRMINGYFVLD